MPRFTTANAREMAARSVVVRKQAKAEREQRLAADPLSASSPADESQRISVACVRARLDTLDGLMAKAKTDREWDNLTRAYDRMFRVWCVLTKTPGPGNLKPRPEPARRIEKMLAQPTIATESTAVMELTPITELERVMGRNPDGSHEPPEPGDE